MNQRPQYVHHPSTHTPPLLTTGNDTIPGQQGNTSVYASELRAIALQLRARAAAYGVKLIYGLTTAYLCALQNDGCVVNLNNQAAAIMAELQISTGVFSRIA